ncbi:hypothetical protein SRHO_G00236270 [Serrasalmus rhombeus]
MWRLDESGDGRQKAACPPSSLGERARLSEPSNPPRDQANIDSRCGRINSAGRDEGALLIEPLVCHFIPAKNSFQRDDRGQQRPFKTLVYDLIGETLAD